MAEKLEGSQVVMMNALSGLTIGRTMFIDFLFPVDDPILRQAEEGNDDLAVFLFTDELTGLHNKRSFGHQIEKHRDHVERKGGCFSLLYIDVDRFRHFIEQNGHAAADSILITISNILSRELLKNSVLFRHSNDEFLAIIANAGEDLALERAVQLQRQIETFFESEGTKSITVSIAVAVYPDHATGISSLLQWLDRAMKSCKATGTSQITSVSSLKAATTKGSSSRIRCRGLVGRAQEWNRLQEIYSNCKKGVAQFVFLSGESGIGKSHFLKSFLHGRREGDCTVFSGESSDLNAPPNEVLRNALRNGIEEHSFVRELTSLLPDETPDIIARLTSSQLPIDISKSSIQSFPDYVDERYCGAIHLLVRAVTRRSPMVLALDGIRAHDSLVLSLLQILSRECRNRPLMIIVIFDKELEVSPILKWFSQSMTGSGQFEEIVFKPLSREESSLVVSSIFQGMPVSETFRNWVYDETIGNPFYIEELIQLAVEEGMIQISGGAIDLTKTDPVLIPDSVRNPILQRIRNLNETYQHILRFAAVIGYEVEGRLICSLMSEWTDFREEMLEELAQLNFFRFDSTADRRIFQFLNQRVRDLIYEEMGKFNRRMYHERVAEQLEQTQEEDLETIRALAYHFARTGNATRALHYMYKGECNSEQNV